MKILKFLVVMVIVLSLTASVRAQETPPLYEPTYKLEFTLAEVIDIMAEYEIRHIEYLPQQPVPWYGLTDYFTQKIFIFDTQDHAGKKHTLIHEVLHVMYNRRGLHPADEIIDAMATNVYWQLYGIKEQK